ncbi:MAG TPA: aminotransferase class IV [Gemmatimonadaceae bacterium]|nr:aminotransferase class IV [Gemmatimonadaceae bacterium]
MLIYLNGAFLPRSEARIPIEDRGFIFGDGVYEVWRLIGGNAFEPEQHLARLERGLREIEIALPDDLRAPRLWSIAQRLLGENDLTSGEATLYVEVTRGAAPRTHYYPPAGTPATVYMAAARFTPRESLRRSGAAAITQPDIRWLRCDLKTIQLLPNVMAKQRAVSSGAIDAVFVRNGMVTEGTHTSIFGVIGGVLRTHPADHHVLPGVTRAVVLQIATELGIPSAETPMSVNELFAASELFLTGTTTDVLPIIKVDDRVIGTGAPGPVAEQLFQELRARMDAVGSDRADPRFERPREGRPAAIAD